MGMNNATVAANDKNVEKSTFELPGWGKEDWDYLLESNWGKELKLCSIGNICTCDDFNTAYIR